MINEENRQRNITQSPGLAARRQHIDAQLAQSPKDIIRIINDNETRNFQLGVVLIVVAIVSWIIGLELVNSVLKGDEYKKPFMFAWITGSCFSLNLGVDVLNWMKPSKFKRDNTTSSLEYHDHMDFPIETDALLSVSSTSSVEKLPDGPVELSRMEIFVLAFQMAAIYYFYNIFGMFALQFTSASNQTVLGSTTSIFTLFIGVFWGIDKFSIKKIICIFISLSGVFLINWSESEKHNNTEGGGNDNKFVPKNPTLGNSLAIMGAFMYALYLIVMKVKCGTGNKTTNERQLFGFVGVLTFFMGIPILLVAHFAGIETFEFPPPSNKILISIIINGLTSFTSDYTTILAMLLTSPLVTSLSLTSAIPITIFLDFIILHISGGSHSTPPSNKSNSYIYFFGIACILTSVVLINVNITTENELINEYIDDTLEDAIRGDDALSPVLSPLLSPNHSLATASGFESPFTNASDTMLRKPLGVSFSTVLQSFSPVSKPAGAPETKIRGLQLPQSQNPQFHTIDGVKNQIEDNKMLIYGGENHRYRVKNVQSMGSTNLD